MKKLELYIHIPFCIRKCAYCDFASGPCDRKEQTAYFKALREEIRQIAGKRKPQEEEEVTSCFFGGGTPSVPDPEELSLTLRTLQECFVFAEDCEITLEANPGTLTAEKLSVYIRSGFNRISLGCQAVQDRLLKRIGRIHTFGEVEETIRMVRQAGFTNLNVDLMSGLPGQSFADYEESLRTIAELGCEHISAYSLILEEGTPLWEEADELELPDEDTERKMYEETQSILSEYGFSQYEISNYAKPGYACRHNIGYWERTDYLGFGLSAASLDGRIRRTNGRDLAAYIRAFAAADAKCGEEESLDGQNTPASSGDILEEYAELSDQDCMEETMFLGLRMMQGVSKEAFAQQYGKAIEEVYGDVIAKYVRLGLLKDQDGRIALTREGISVSNPILAEFLL